MRIKIKLENLRKTNKKNILNLNIIYLDNIKSKLIKISFKVRLLYFIQKGNGFLISLNQYCLALFFNIYIYIYILVY